MWAPRLRKRLLLLAQSDHAGVAEVAEAALAPARLLWARAIVVSRAFRLPPAPDGRGASCPPSTAARTPLALLPLIDMCDHARGAGLGRALAYEEGSCGGDGEERGGQRLVLRSAADACALLPTSQAPMHMKPAWTN